ncbi:hypothetical protein [Estrella lausannensis]|uniref:Conserved putative secreted protein n=1 Tax=Estrella lausannensis TaxID=483423 RepID=A0A0H5DRX1_9BACT|nr:hypothetical protein [Estrella lausannensis]CRX38983.1 Conserved putative secreted protein [Estrella lausannensis]
MKQKIYLAAAAFTLLALFLLSDRLGTFFESLQIYAEGGHRQVFEPKLSAEQIMNQKRAELLQNSAHTYHKASLMLAPYILMETKFVDDNNRSREGWLLWSEVDGEIVFDTDSWQTTHGYRDALQSGADEGDYLLMHALVKRKGSAARELLRRDLKMEKDPFDKRVKSASKKNLVALFGDTVGLHVHNPKIASMPPSRVSHPFVMREVELSALIPRTFSEASIQKAAKASFGKNFTIRSSKEVFLPLWKIEVKKPDGSLSISYWNAVNGSKASLFDF